MARKHRGKRLSTPMMMFWDRRDQKRFIDAAESLICLSHDLKAHVTQEQRKAAARALKRDRLNGHAAGGDLPDAPGGRPGKGA